MAPKRRAATAAGPISASQPTPQRPNTRSARKRRLSDAASEMSDVSIASSQAASTMSTRATKRKRQTVAEGDVQVIVEEEEVISERETTAPACDQGNEPEQNDEEIEVSQPSKRVRLNSTQPEQPNETTTKMTIKRRKSSSTKGHTVKRLRVSRTSLPAALASDGAEPTQLVQTFALSPLSTVLKKRMAERKTSMLDGTEDEVEDDKLVLDAHEESVYPDLGAVSTAPVMDAASQEHGKAVVLAKRVGHNMNEEERSQLQNAVIALERESNDAKARLKVQQIAILALGFGIGSADGEKTVEERAEHVIRSIRTAFDETLSFLDAELPGSVLDDVTNEDILSVLKATLREFANRLRNADREAREWSSVRDNLVSQINHLLDQLSDSKLQCTDLKHDKERLTTTLNEYIDEETRLKELITKMEQEHRDTFAKINTERETTVRRLEDERDQATEFFNDRLVRIENLQGQVKAVEAERDNLIDQLQEAQAELDTEINAKEKAEEDCARQAFETQELQARIDSLDNDIADLNQDIDSLRALKDSEHDQRVAAETELDQKNSSIESLDAKIRDAGKESNELRAKIFELQNFNSKQEQVATAREQEYDSELAAEVNRREAAVELAEAREAEIVRLEADLKNTEERLRKLEAEKDARINALEESVAQKDTEIQGMEDEYRTDLESRDETIEELRTTIDEFEDAYKNSQEEASDYKAQVEARDITIDGLQEQISSLEKEKSSLEDRVEKEAVHTLELQNGLEAEISNLKADLEERQEKLNIVYEKREQEEEAIRELEEARDAEVAGLVARHDRKVEMLQDNIDDLKRQLAAFFRQAHKSLVQRQEARREQEAQEDAEDEALKAGFMK